MISYTATKSRQCCSVVLLSLFCFLFGCAKTDENKIETNLSRYDKVVTTQPSEVNEKEILRSSYFGDFSKCKVIKKKGSVTLEQWRPGYEYRVQTYPKEMYDLLEKDILLKLNIEYDEIWITENVDGLTKKEKIKWKGQNDIMKLYWKNDKVQAYTLSKLYISNPLTDIKLPNPEHEITIIHDRSYIINHPKEH